MNENEWLCPQCKYGHLLRIVKNAQRIPTHSEYLCADLPPGERDVFAAPDGPGGWDGKTCPNFISRRLTRTCQFYALGNAENELLAHDEYDSWGSGRYYTGDVFMCRRYTLSEAEAEQRERGHRIYLVTITKQGEERSIAIAER